MGRTVFQVTLYNFRCDALSCGNAKTYLKVNFAGGYKNLQSETSEDQIYNFGMASSFNFTTNYGHRLDAKAIEVQCFQKNALFSDELVGTALVDLHTVATGPVSHRLTLVSALSLSGGGGGKKCGTVLFDCDMVEVSAAMQVRLVNAAISMPDISLEAGALTSLVVTYSATEDVSKTSNVVAPSSLSPAAAAGFVFAEALSTAGSLTDMENSVVSVSVKKHFGGRETIVGTARLSLLSLYQVGASSVAFHEKILNAQTRAPIGDLHGQLQIADGPSFAQMIGGLNTSEGVQPGAQRFLSMPLPLRLLGQPPNLAALMVQNKSSGDRRGSGIVAPPSPRLDAVAPAAPVAAASSASPMPPSLSPRQFANAPPTIGQPQQPQQRSGSNLVLPAGAMPATIGASAAASSAKPVPLPSSITKAADGRVMSVQLHAPNVQQQPIPVPMQQQQYQHQQHQHQQFQQHQHQQFQQHQQQNYQQQPQQQQPLQHPPYIAPPPHPRKKTQFDDLAPMPRGWGLAVNAQSQVYFKYHETRQTTWQDPRLLPSGYEQRLNPQGRLYFANSLTKATSWVDPRGLPAGWSMQIVAGDAQPIFVEAAHGFRTRVDPRGVPPGYSMHVADATGKIYFKVHAERRTQWDDPRLRMSAPQLAECCAAERAAWESAQTQAFVAEATKINPLDEFEMVMKTRQADIDLARAAWLKQQTQVWAAQKAEHDKEVAAKIKLATEAIHHEAQAWVTAFELEKKQITQARDATDAKSREALEEEYERFIISLESGHGGAAAVASPGAALPAVIGQSQSQSQSNGAAVGLPATIGAAPAQSQSSAGSLPGVIGQSQPQQQPQVAASMPAVIGASQPQPQVSASLPGVIGASQSQQAASNLPSVIGQ